MKFYNLVRYGLFDRYLLQILRIMKLTTFIIAITLMQVSAASKAQISLNKKNVPMREVFKSITAQTGFDILYSDNTLNDLKKISIQVSNEPIESVLDRCFEGQPLEYEIDNKTVIVKKKTPSFLDRVVAAFAAIDVRGRVVDSETGQGLPGATVSVKGVSSKSTNTNAEGEFYLQDVDEGAVVVVSFVGYKVMEMAAVKEMGVIKLEMTSGDLQEVNVTYSTGYQKLDPGKTTGSFVQLDKELLNRRVGTNILDRLDGVTSGLIFAKNRTNSAEASFSIRGRSTIFASAEPLVVLDNFPYEGDINNINPNDIESITVLKDAAAASIWGVRAANGVVVITSKKGSLNTPASIAFNSNVTVGAKPDVHYSPQLSSSEFIDVEKTLFDQGAYDFYLTYAGFEYYPLSPVIELLDKHKRNVIGTDQLNQELARLGGIDARDAQQRYFYQNSVNQQYNLNINGGGQNQKYYISGGYDQNRDHVVGTSYQRFTLNVNNSNYLFNQKLEVSNKLLFSSGINARSLDIYTPKYPYEEIIDANGNPLATVREHRLSFVESARSLPGMLDWGYYPLNERKPNGEDELLDYRWDFGLNYKVVKGLTASFLYQYGRSQNDYEQDYNKDAYYTRNLINRFSLLNPSSGSFESAIPLGSILTRSDSQVRNQYGRFQVNYGNTFAERHQLNLLAGVEARSAKAFNTSNLMYGYDHETANNAQIDYFKDYPQYDLGYPVKISRAGGQSGTIDNYRSYYASGSYTFDGRYTVSGSVRRDESNLFGVATNAKGVPLWAAGAAWNIHQEKFYKTDWLPLLKLRLTQGYNGNVDRTVSAFVTGAFNHINNYQQPTVNITNPPNAGLRWEKVRVTNAAVDFGLKKNILTGSIELYRKNSTDLIGNSLPALQTGVTLFRGNNANMLTKGLDLTLKSLNINRELSWTTNFFLSYTKDEVTKYLAKHSSNSQYVNGNFLGPMEGRPLMALFSYKWGGLDPATGNPIGYLSGEKSQNHYAIVSSSNPDELVYSGSAVPQLFGSVRNNFSYKQLELSFNVVFKAKYVFRDVPMDYSKLLYGGTYFYQKGFAERWQKPGDEAKTNVPSMLYPPDDSRDAVYANSEILIEKGDHIRLQDIKLNYALALNAGRNTSFKNLNIYAYANNLGILWKRTKSGLDPDAHELGFLPAPRTFAFGLSTSF